MRLRRSRPDEVVISGAIIVRVLRRFFAPHSYPWLFGLLQLVLVITLHRLWPWWLPAAGGLALAVLLGVVVTTRDRWRLKGFLLALVIGLLTIAPTIAVIATREHSGITSIEEDSAVQTELAVDRLLHGSPIYGSDWTNTVMSHMAWETSLAPSNPALHHFVYFPLTVLSAVPVRLGVAAVGLTFDYRMVLLVFIAVGLFSVWFLPIPAPDRFAIAIALFLNPLVTLYLWIGRNDLAFAGLIVLVVALLARGRPGWASLTVGFAAAFKLFAAPAIVVLLAVLWLRFRRRHDWREVAFCLLALLAVPGATILPFLLAGPTAFFHDVILYPGGGLPDSYPIAGFGFGGILLRLGLVHHQDYFPFAIFQAAAIAAAAFLGLRAFFARPTMRRWMVAYLALFFALAFFARYFNDSHLGVLAAMALCCRPLGDHPVVMVAPQSVIARAA